MLRSLIAITIISFGAGPVAAQEAMFILRAGKDTISLERFTVTATRIESEILLKPNAVRLRFSGAIGADGLIGSLENNFWMGTDSATAPSRQRAVITLTGDSAFAAIGGGGPTRTERLGTKAGALPYINPSFALLEVFLRRAKTLGTNPAEVFQAAGNRDVTAKVLPNLNHLFVYDPDGFPGRYTELKSFAVDRPTIGLVVDWLVKRMAKPTA